MNHISIRWNHFFALCLLSFFQNTCPVEASFFDKVAEITQNLYRVSAQELQTHLGISLSHPPLITADDLKNALENNPTLCVINVLPASLHEDCHITGSINVPLKQLVDTARSWNTNKKIIVYCALDECDAGEKAYILLASMGFTDVTDYKGGIKEWFQLGYPTEGPATFEFLHTKSSTISECDLYPKLLVCSRQMRWIQTDNTH